MKINLKPKVATAGEPPRPGPTTSPPREDKTPQAFLDFFDDEWKDRLGKAAIPGMPGASWDRRAAWLLYKALGR